MKWRSWIFWIVAAVVVGGCVPEKYEWSPDGRWMTVLSSIGLNFTDSNGDLQPASVKDVKIATWFPDSRRVLVDRQVSVTTWDELLPYLPPERAAEIIQAAGRMREAALAFTGWSEPDSDQASGNFWAWFVKREEQSGGDSDLLNSSLSGAIGVYFQSHADAAVRQKIPAAIWKNSPASQAVNVVEVRAMDAPADASGVRVMVSFGDVSVLRVSPTGQAALVITSSDKKKEKQSDADVYELWVVSTDGVQPAKKLSSPAAWYPDWSADGKDVFFVRSSGNGNPSSLGSLSRMRVADDSGRLLEKPGDPEDLADLFFDPFARVRCMKDGRIFFSGLEGTLPATPEDMPQQQELMAIWPGKEATVSRLLPKRGRAAMGDAAQYFEVSPDGARVSIPSKDGRVSVIELASGQVTQVQTESIPGNDHNDLTLPTVPSWRNSDELVFEAPGGDGKLKVVLWSVSKNSGQTISADWPPEMIDQPPPAATQPTAPLTPATATQP